MPEEIFLARPTPPPTSPVKKTGQVQRDERSSLLSFKQTLDEEEKKRPVDSAPIPVFGPVPALVVPADPERAAPAKSAVNPPAAGVSSTPGSGAMMAAGESKTGTLNRSAKDKAGRSALQGPVETATQDRAHTEGVPTQGPVVQVKAGSETSPANSVGGSLLQASLAGDSGLQALPGQNQPLPVAAGAQPRVLPGSDSGSKVQPAATVQAVADLPADTQAQLLPVSTTAVPVNKPVPPTLFQQVSSDPQPNQAIKQVGHGEPVRTAAGKVPTQEQPGQVALGAPKLGQPGSIQVQTRQFVDSAVSNPPQTKQSISDGKPVLDASPAPSQPLQAQTPVLQTNQPESVQAIVLQAADSIVPNPALSEQAGKAGKPTLEASSAPKQPLQAQATSVSPSKPESVKVPIEQTVDPVVPNPFWSEQAAPSEKPILKTSHEQDQPLQAPIPIAETNQPESNQADTSKKADAAVSASPHPEKADLVGKPVLETSSAPGQPLQALVPVETPTHPVSVQASDVQAANPSVSTPLRSVQAAPVGEPMLKTNPEQGQQLQSPVAKPSQPEPSQTPTAGQVDPSPSTPAQAPAVMKASLAAQTLQDQPVHPDRAATVSAVQFRSPDQPTFQAVQPQVEQGGSSPKNDNIIGQTELLASPSGKAQPASHPVDGLPVRVSNQTPAFVPSLLRPRQDGGHVSESSAPISRMAGLPVSEAGHDVGRSLEIPAADPTQAPASPDAGQSKPPVELRGIPQQAPVSAQEDSAPSEAFKNGSGAAHPASLKVSPPSTDQKNGQAGEESLAKGEAPRQVSKKAASQIAYSSDPLTFPAEIQAGGSKGSVQSGKPDLSVIQQVIDKIQEAVQEGHTSLRMQLNPKNLGAIDLRLVSNGQSVSITMIAEQPGTGQLLEKQMDQLRANLAGAGINLANVNIGHQAANGQQGGGFTREPTPERFMEGGRNTSESQLEPGSSPYTNRAKTDSRIDYRI